MSPLLPLVKPAYLGQERVRRVRGIPVVPDFKLVVGVDDLLRGLAKGSCSRSNKWFDEWLERSDDKD